MPYLKVCVVFLALILCGLTHRHRKHRSEHSWIEVCQIGHNELEFNKSITQPCFCDELGEMNCISSGESLTRLKTVNIRLKNPLYKPKRIYLRYNSIDVFERNKLISGQEKDVEYLGLQNNQLIRIEDAAFDTFELKSLHLSNNFLKLDSSGKNWLTEKLGSTLQILSLDNNLIELLPDQIFDNLISLDTLILKNNPSLGLSDNVFGTNIRNLRELSLSSCNLNSIPPLLFRNLVGLKHLHLNDNPLISIPTALRWAPNLIDLDISQTKLSEITPNAFIVAQKLIHLTMKNMTTLELIDQCAFCDLSQLISIDLSNSSRLREIHENAFGLAKGYMNATYKLSRFYAANCAFESFSHKLLDWTKMKMVSISGNPFKCDEAIEWLKNDTKIILSSLPRCHTPIGKRGEFVRRYDAEIYPSEKRSINWKLVALLICAGVLFSLYGIILCAYLKDVLDCIKQTCCIQA